MAVVLGVIGYLLKIGLGVTGAALGPEAQSDAGQGSASSSLQGAAPQDGGAPNGVGGGTSVQAGAGAPPAPIQRILTDLRGRVARNPRDAAALEGLAGLYFDAGKFAQAIAYDRRALAVDPKNLGVRTDYAVALHDLGDDAAAQAQLRVVLASWPEFPSALLAEGVVANATGRRAEAIAAYQKFLKVAPKDQRADDARAALHNLGAS
jgi:tetratricopeptide (TPR) repeat protein